MPDPCVQGFVFGQASDKLQGVRVLAESRAYGVGHCVVRAVVIADHAGDAVIQSGDLESARFGVGGRQVFDFVDGDVHVDSGLSATCTPMPKGHQAASSDSCELVFSLPSRWTGAGRGPCLTCSQASLGFRLRPTLSWAVQGWTPPPGSWAIGPCTSPVIFAVRKLSRWHGCILCTFKSTCQQPYKMVGYCPERGVGFAFY